MLIAAGEFRVVSVDESQSSDKHAGEGALQVPLHFYKKRNRFYTLLLLFVVVIGLPIVSVSHLRNRLSARIMLLKAAVAGNVKPAIAQVGANQEPFPSEYEKPEPPAHQAFKLPPAATFIQQTPRVYIPAPGDPAKTNTPTVLNSEGLGLLIEGEDFMTPEEAALAEAEESGPKYQQGEIEQDAYDLLLESNTSIAEMVRGSDSSVVFNSWDATHRGDGIYWVRVKFQSEDNSVREYIWQVDLDSNEITPLSYHARSIS